MQPTAQAWPIGRARLGAACFALLAHARAASALIMLLIVQTCMSTLDYDVIHTVMTPTRGPAPRVLSP